MVYSNLVILKYMAQNSYNWGLNLLITEQNLITLHDLSGTFNFGHCIPMTNKTPNFIFSPLSLLLTYLLAEHRLFTILQIIF